MPASPLFKRGFCVLSQRVRRDVNECSGGGENAAPASAAGRLLRVQLRRGYVGQYSRAAAGGVPNIQAGHAYVGREELIGASPRCFWSSPLIVPPSLPQEGLPKSYSRNNITLVQDLATAALLRKSNGVPFLEPA